MRRKKYLLLAVKLAVPAVLLYAIFRGVDLAVLAEHFRRVRPSYFLAGLVGGVVSQVFVAAYRWRYMLARGYSIDLPYRFLLRQYWIGMFLGYFVPAGIGVDAYRVAAVYRKAGRLGANVAAILIEKLIGAAGAVLVIFAAYPLIASRLKCSAEAASILNRGYLISLSAAATTVILWIVARNGTAVLFSRIKNALLRRLTALTDEMAVRISNRVDRGRPTERLRPRESTCEHRERKPPPLPRWRYLGTIVLLTVVIRVLAAIAVYCFFAALGHEVSLTVALFAFSVIFLLFMLPISFGSLGVREGAYIVLFGLFSVPRETALAASFLGLAALLCTISVGGVILLVGAACSNGPDRS